MDKRLTDGQVRRLMEETLGPVGEPSALPGLARDARALSNASVVMEVSW